jgi:hypothetical protein
VDSNLPFMQNPVWVIPENPIFVFSRANLVLVSWWALCDHLENMKGWCGAIRAKDQTFQAIMEQDFWTWWSLLSPSNIYCALLQRHKRDKGSLGASITH